jgi:SAM-dependent methyltransferase
MARAKKSLAPAGGDLPYRDDLAFIHDVGFGHMARGAAEVLLTRLPVSRSAVRRMVDLGCGSGILSERMAKSGYEVIGYDLSEAMIKLCKSRVPSGNFHQASILDAEMPACSMAAAVGEIVNYLFDASHSLVRLTKLIRRVAKSLEPGGLFLVDGAAPGRGLKPGGYQVFREGPGWFCAVHAIEEGNPAVLTRTITSFVQKGEHYRRDHEVHRLRLIEPDWMRETLKSAGLHVRRIRGYPDAPFPKGYFSFLATKPRSG